MTPVPSPHELSLLDVRHAPGDDGTEHVELVTDRGVITGRLHDGTPGDAAVLWVFGAGGGFHGPAGGLYDRLGAALAPTGLASLQVAYRHPADLLECVLDTLVGVGYLVERGRTRVVLVGHSFGGAVVITAGAASDAVIAVAALSSQTAGTVAAPRLAPRPLFLAHGIADEVLPYQCSRDIYARAAEPKRMVLYPDCRHGLDGCRDALDADLGAWLREVTSPPADA
ncbi:MAG TPA: alpha/beta hydrolase [Gemmatirosa sp.]